MTKYSTHYEIRYLLDGQTVGVRVYDDGDFASASNDYYRTVVEIRGDLDLNITRKGVELIEVRTGDYKPGREVVSSAGRLL